MTTETSMASGSMAVSKILDELDRIIAAKEAEEGQEEGHDDYLSNRDSIVEAVSKDIQGVNRVLNYYKGVLAAVKDGKDRGEFTKEDTPGESRARKEVFVTVAFIAHDLKELTEKAFVLAEEWQKGANPDSPLNCPVARDRESVIDFHKVFIKPHWDKTLSDREDTDASEGG